MAKEPDKFFIERVLHVSSGKLVASISAPLPRNRHTEWHCWVDIKLIPGASVHRERVIGIDSWQSIQTAMWLAQKIINERFPDAYAFEPGDGPGFYIIVQEALPYGYSKRLRKHLEAECARKTRELSQEIRKKKSKRKLKR